MKKLLCLALTAALLAGCTALPENTAPSATETAPAGAQERLGEVKITLSDESIGIDYSTSGTNGVIDVTEETGVYTANDIIYYEAGHDFTYGEGESWEAHTPEEAAAHTVVHITKPGTYRITGRLGLGQIAVDLGEGAEEDPTAVVTLILDDADITCTVAPAIIFYNVYECGDADDPRADVDTSAAGANVVLEAGSVNHVVGSHVAKIYKPESVVLTADGTEVEDAKKLHKYDAAFYSRMSMNVGGEGQLYITADNEGLDSELHLTVNGGDIHIFSGNDGINTNEDGVSVTTVNGGSLRITVTGETGEGDGIDSNGWLVINGGLVEAYGCGTSGDAGIDSDMGIHIYGGTVCATGNMLDRIEEGGQTFAVFTFIGRQSPGVFTLKDESGAAVLEFETENSFQYLILSAPELTGGTYTLWSGETQFEGSPSSGGGMGFGFVGQLEPIDPGDRPGKGGDVEIPPQPTQPVVTQGTGQSADPGQTPENDMSVQGAGPAIPEIPAGEIPEGNLPEGIEPPTDREPPEGFSTPGLPPEGGEGFMPGGSAQVALKAAAPEFELQSGGNYFVNVQPVTKGSV